MTTQDPAYPVGHTVPLSVTVDTPWGVYSPGCAVLVVAGSADGGWTIDTDPERPNARHRVDVPRDALDVALDGEHGTAAGARRHQRRHEPMCRPCAAAYAKYLQTYRVRRGISRTVPVPVEVLGALYLNAPITTQQQVEGVLGTDLLDACVAQHDGLAAEALRAAA